MTRLAAVPLIALALGLAGCAKQTEADNSALGNDVDASATGGDNLTAIDGGAPGDLTTNGFDEANAADANLSLSDNAVAGNGVADNGN